MPTPFDEFVRYAVDVINEALVASMSPGTKAVTEESQLP